MKLDEPLARETEDAEGTTTTKEELISVEGLEEDAITLAFPITVDGWLIPVD